MRYAWRLRGTVLPLALAVLAGACGGRRPPVPDIAGPLADVVMRAAFQGDGDAAVPAGGALLLDSLSFGRLGAAAGGAAFPAAELARQFSRAHRLVDPRDVLVCADREPCRTVDDAVYLEVWSAEPAGDGLDVVVNRVFNARGLHVATRSVAHRLTVRQVGGIWRLTAVQRLPT